MTDGDLRELAAKAAGMNVEYVAQYGVKELFDNDAHREWNPLEDDGDAMRLAVKLRIQVTPGVYNKDEFSAYSAGAAEAHERYSYQQDEYAATRRAIVRAAAEIGKALP